MAGKKTKKKNLSHKNLSRNPSLDLNDTRDVLQWQRQFGKSAAARAPTASALNTERRAERAANELKQKYESRPPSRCNSGRTYDVGGDKSATTSTTSRYDVGGDKSATRSMASRYDVGGDKSATRSTAASRTVTPSPVNLHSSPSSPPRQSQLLPIIGLRTCDSESSSTSHGDYIVTDSDPDRSRRYSAPGILFPARKEERIRRSSAPEPSCSNYLGLPSEQMVPMLPLLPLRDGVEKPVAMGSAASSQNYVPPSSYSEQFDLSIAMKSASLPENSAYYWNVINKFDDIILAARSEIRASKNSLLLKSRGTDGKGFTREMVATLESTRKEFDKSDKKLKKMHKKILSAEQSLQVMVRQYGNTAMDLIGTQKGIASQLHAWTKEYQL